MINTQRYSDPQKYFDLVKDYLHEQEAANNLAFGILNDSIKKERNPNDLFIISQEDEKVVFLMIRTSQSLLIIGEANYLGAAIEFLVKEGIEIKGIIGQSDLAKAFAIEWESTTGNSWEIEMDQIVYKLDQVSEIPMVSGRLRKAQIEDSDILMEKFFEGEEEKLRLKLDQYFREESLYLWDDGEIVSMVRKSRPTENGIAINHVFTPIEYRKRGYSTSCVHAFSKMLLEEYEFCVLYTELANPASNRVYRKIGYQPIMDSIMIAFD